MANIWKVMRFFRLGLVYPMTELLNSDRRLSVFGMISETRSCKTILRYLVNDDLNIGKMCAKLAPTLLTDDCKYLRMMIFLNSDCQ